MQDTRAADGKASLLTFAAARLTAAGAPLLSEELPHVAGPRLRVSLREVEEAVAGEEARAEEARAALAAAADAGDSALLAALGDTPAEVGRQLVAVRARLAAVRSSFAALASYYGESPVALSSEQELWAGVQAFVLAFTAAQQAALRRAADEEEERQRKQRGATRPSRGSVKGSGPGPAAPPAAGSPGKAAAGQEDSTVQKLQFGSPERGMGDADATVTLASRPVGRIPAEAPTRPLFLSS